MNNEKILDTMIQISNPGKDYFIFSKTAFGKLSRFSRKPLLEDPGVTIPEETEDALGELDDLEELGI